VGEFVHYLQQDVNGPVFDETGLAGRFDFFFTFESNSWSSNIDHIVPALKEQLGLELVESKRQLDVLVIDHAEKPEFP
jgi:uncharacterized protein (TIGR03435 family)